MSSRHASRGGRRGIANWIIVTAVAVVLVVGAALAYILIVGGDDEAQGACTSQVQLPVVTAPGATPAITDAATAFNATAPVARSACVTAAVTALPDAQAQLALADDWQQAAGTPPAIWVPESEAALHTLEATDSAMTAGRDTSPIATSPVVIAVRDEDAAARPDRRAELGRSGRRDRSGRDGDVALRPASWSSRCPIRPAIGRPVTHCSRCLPTRRGEPSMWRR